jgi:superfamily I DNA and/or RNA helicase
LPLGRRSDYADQLEYAIVEEVINLQDAINTFNKIALLDKNSLERKKKGLPAIKNAIHDMICSGKAVSRKDYDPLKSINAPGLPNSFNKSQIKAVNMAINLKFTIIQGPPGTGKTLTIAAIVVNWLKPENGFGCSSFQILVCAPSNSAADHLAEILYSLLKEKMVRFYPPKREDLFNLTKESVKPYSLLAAVIANCEAAPPADKLDPLSDYCPYLELAKLGRVQVIEGDKKDYYDKKGKKKV